MKIHELEAALDIEDEEEEGEEWLEESENYDEVFAQLEACQEVMEKVLKHWKGRKTALYDELEYTCIATSILINYMIED